jgi:peptidoglycan hydrolase-like protein with peptidoglycan-binding domain
MNIQKLIASLVVSFLPFGAMSSFAEIAHAMPRDLDRLSENASIDCAKVNINASSSTVARILCSGREGVAADWDLNSVLWSIAGTNNEVQQRGFDKEQDRWRAWLNSTCSVQTSSPLFSPSQQQCVIRAFHGRAAALRSQLSGDALAESRLSPEEHARIQLSLGQRGLLQLEPDGEFGATTRQAIKLFQFAEGGVPSGFLTQTQLIRLRSDGGPKQPQIDSATIPKPTVKPAQSAQQNAAAARTFDGTCRGFPEGEQIGMLVAPETEIAKLLEGEGYVACKLIAGSPAATKILSVCFEGSPCEIEGSLRVHDFDVDIIDAKSVKSWESWNGTCYGAVSGVGDGIYSVGVTDAKTSKGGKTPVSCTFFSDSVSAKILAECPEGSICEVKGRFEKQPEAPDIGKEATVPAIIRYVDSVKMKDPPTKVSIPEPQRGVEVSPDLSTPMSLCSAAINDPLRPMIIDSFISGGKHIAPGWTRKIKDEIESDYGSFLNVRDDATVERVDDRTGKVGCAVTYEVNLQGIAGKVLADGATARAQILIRQMAREGNAITRRLEYTVQKTSGGSLMTWFGLATNTQAFPQRSAVRCLVVLGGRCMAWGRQEN